MKIKIYADNNYKCFWPQIKCRAHIMQYFVSLFLYLTVLTGTVCYQQKTERPNLQRWKTQS